MRIPVILDKYGPANKTQFDWSLGGPLLASNLSSDNPLHLLICFAKALAADILNE